METEREQILREFRAEIAELQKEFNARTKGLMLRISHELGEVEPAPTEALAHSPYQPQWRNRKVKCGRL